MASSRAGWRLREHGPAFLEWLEQDAILERALARLAADLESFLLAGLDDTQSGETFMEAIPDVIGRCNDEIYNLPLRPEAYAFIHLLDESFHGW